MILPLVLINFILIVQIFSFLPYYFLVQETVMIPFVVKTALLSFDNFMNFLFPWRVLLRLPGLKHSFKIQFTLSSLFTQSSHFEKPFTDFFGSIQICPFIKGQVNFEHQDKILGFWELSRGQLASQCRVWKLQMLISKCFHVLLSCVPW